MKIGILSDTHDQIERTAEAVRLLKTAGAEVLFHCGDLTRPSMVPIVAVTNTYFVFGNNDFTLADQIRTEIEEIEGAVSLEWGGHVSLAGKTIAMTHGHRNSEVRRLMALQPDYFLFGHSHIAEDVREGGVRRINPGALHRAGRFSVALLDLSNDQLRFFDVPR